jgi:hypothetical protein
MPQEVAGGRDVRGETIQLFSDIGLGRQQKRFLVQTVLVEIGIAGEQSKGLREPRPDRLGLAGWREFGRLRQRGHAFRLRREQCREGSALVLTRGNQVIERRTEEIERVARVCKIVASSSAASEMATTPRIARRPSRVAGAILAGSSIRVIAATRSLSKS